MLSRASSPPPREVLWPIPPNSPRGTLRTLDPPENSPSKRPCYTVSLTGPPIKPTPPIIEGGSFFNITQKDGWVTKTIKFGISHKATMPFFDKRTSSINSKGKEMLQEESNRSEKITQKLESINASLKAQCFKTSFAMASITYNSELECLTSPYAKGTRLDELKITNDTNYTLTLIETGADIALSDSDYASEYFINVFSHIHILNRDYFKLKTEWDCEKLETLFGLDTAQDIKRELQHLFFYTQEQESTYDTQLDIIASIIFLSKSLKDENLLIDVNFKNFICTESSDTSSSSSDSGASSSIDRY